MKGFCRAGGSCSTYPAACTDAVSRAGAFADDVLLWPALAARLTHRVIAPPARQRREEGEAAGLTGRALRIGLITARPQRVGLGRAALGARLALHVGHGGTRRLGKLRGRARADCRR